MLPITPSITSVSKYIKNNPLKIIVFFSILYPFLLSLNNIVNGSIPFWYDPARDFLLALNNLKSPTLIGPPSGIPGIFYGPYWIWQISLTLIFSRDPRLGAIIILLIPYFTIFPFFLFKFAKIYGVKICLLLWLLFIFSSQTYTTFLWNPHLAPLFFLLLIYILVIWVTSKVNPANYLKLFIAGITSGLLLNYHISFGLGIFFASFIYLTSITILNRIKKKINIIHFIIHLFAPLVTFILGFFITITPFIVFEFRHNFLQTTTLIKTITDAIIYNSATVGQTGLKFHEITEKLFFGKAANMFTFGNDQVKAIYLLVFAILIYKLIKKKIKFDEGERKMIFYLTASVLAVFLIYITSKNPVWEYHFIGVEILVILTTGILIKKLDFLKNHLSFWLIIFVLASFMQLIASFKANPYALSSLTTKKYIVKLIYENANQQSFAVAAYSPAIYTYDFDYLFQWLGKDVYRQFPETNPDKPSLVYLIIPKTSEATQTDFINSKTPVEKYKTDKEWKLDDGTTVIKRVTVTK